MAPTAATDNIKPRGTLKRAHVHANLVQEVFFGNVLSANLGQAPARQAALGAGIPNSVVCTTINKVCSSGMKATTHAVQSIQLGINDVVVAGGMESMCNAPKYLAETRKGSRLGHDMVIDGMLKDGLWDVYNDYAMGMCAELCADQRTITREEQFPLLLTLRSCLLLFNLCFSCFLSLFSISERRFFSEYYLFSDHLMALAAATDNIEPRGALKRAHGHANLVQEVFFGNVLSANLGQAA
ncbi:hypothetical protein MRB53_023216 [Persea americana]|uniref:Uncharacterized protein n=1 Tax=Persea americana TaxID=3435 RepID=A0ACC2LA07_PERAE|nr:hypothetical protein MRB53_023216 [Persea americana]